MIDRNAAAIPDTCGAAMLVPLSSTYRHFSAFDSAAPALSTRPALASATAVAFILPAAHDRIFSPGATTSGLSRPSPVGPFDEKYETP